MKNQLRIIRIIQATGAAAKEWEKGRVGKFITKAACDRAENCVQQLYAFINLIMKVFKLA